MTTTVTLEDRKVAHVGDRVFNYYDRVPVNITEIGSDGWCDTKLDDGSRGAYLDGSRMCSISFAEAKGWV